MKKHLLILFGIIFFLMQPFFLWLLEPEETLDVAVLDKTVPQENYREHHGLIWLLQHYKYRAAEGEPYRNIADYYGFIPDEADESYGIRTLPPSLDGTDLIYVADTYGVYKEDLAWNEEIASGDALELCWLVNTFKLYENRLATPLAAFLFPDSAARKQAHRLLPVCLFPVFT
ncbi:hypothetical protein [Planococcus lenghuensis]|uniref:Uncharacterized protein n=1 Tax=Planococcus lenghuensis TaxID=2213202 RepID=A0A1Q2L0P3_9BACL|nr:hypothetical protein [Planococcus lenghuensis]AQQ54001.1 hypothetical protein B0X71_13450 [Planococcus lenghuensis]